jgi:hypothetical protein
MSEEHTIVSFTEYQKRKLHGITKGVGICALFSPQGDWAFDYALALARHHSTGLYIFHFLSSPYMLRRDVVFVDAEHKVTGRVTPELIVQKDREFRERFEERLGDYVNVGFRLCEGNSEVELRKCFRKMQYEVLVVGYEGRGAHFGDQSTVEEFAEKFKGPVVLVGPDASDAFHFNKAATGRLGDLMLGGGTWTPIRP